MSLTSSQKRIILAYIQRKGDKHFTYSDISMILKNARTAETEDLLDFIVEYSLKQLGSRNYPPFAINLIEFLYVLLKDIKEKKAQLLTDELLDNIKTIIILYNKIEKKDDFSTSNIEKIKDLLSLDITQNEIELPETTRQKLEIDSLKREAEKLEEKIASLEKRIKDLLENNIRITAEKSGLKNKKEEATKRLRIASEKLEETVQELNAATEELKALRDSLGKKDTQIEILNRKIKELEKSLLEYTEKERIQTSKEELLGRAIDLIISLIIRGKTNERTIKQELNSNGINLDDKEYLECLKKVRTKIGITTGVFDGAKSYRILEPLYQTNQELDLTVTDKCLNLLVLSDFHLTYNSDIEEIANTINTYAVYNNISLVAILGDFFGFKYDNIEPFTRYKNSIELVEKCLDSFPRKSGVTYALLGGNHDKDTHKYGYDAIKLFTDNRDDFINLGYDSAILRINGIVSYKTSLLLHHLQKKITDPVGLTSFNTKYYQTYLESYYKSNGMSLKDYYTCLIGGAHMSGVYNNFTLVPSYLRDRNYNGAIHLKAYLNGRNEIDNLVFVNLVNNGHLQQVSETQYRKN